MIKYILSVLLQYFCVLLKIHRTKIMQDSNWNMCIYCTEGVGLLDQDSFKIITEIKIIWT